MRENKIIMIFGVNSGIGYVCIKYFLEKLFYVIVFDIYNNNLIDYMKIDMFLKVV